MKTFFKILVLICIFFCSVPANAQKAPVAYTDTISAIEQTIYLTNPEHKNAVVSSNSHNFDILTLRRNKQTYSANTVFKASPQSKLLALIFAQNYNRVILSKSNKVSLNLKNEINTRAP